MTPKRILIALALAAGLAGAAYVSQAPTSAGEQMTAAADKFLASLTAEQKEKATFDFDNKERTNWHFVPRQDKDKRSTRKGLPLQEMKAEQKALARELVRAGTSEGGYKKALTIMSLEAILRDLETTGSMVRNPEWYFFTVFGTPSKTGKWGWRVEGHHLSLNFTIDRGKALSTTPAFFGANPADVKAGPRKGLRTLPEAEDLAKELFAALKEDQRTAAFHKERFPEIEQAVTKPTKGFDRPQGLAAAKMDDKQRDILKRLIEGYAGRMPPEVAARQLSDVKEAGMDKVHFAFHQENDKPGKPYTYRVQGPTFVIEFLNVQADSAGNPANHIHSCWRNLQGDFGLTQR
ncbi:MAG TPA: DUF3500 domain-containing protein [Gemmataceae bacterium]|nr:DUF3500 domain-containing protein [Gemmataceae bacterium]